MKLINTLFLIISSLIILSGCGSGGDNKKNSDSSLNTSPEIISAPEIYARAGSPYLYKVQTIDNDGDTLKFSLTRPPSGMEIHPDTGTISWIPDSSQGGRNEVAVEVTDGKNKTTQSFTVSVQTSSVIASKVVSSSTGGTVEVLDSSSEFFGTKLDVPPGVLIEDSTISLSKVSFPMYTPEGQSALEIALDGSLSPSSAQAGKKFKLNISGQPVVVTIPYNNSFLRTNNISDETKLKIFVDKSSSLFKWNLGWKVLPNSCNPSAVNSSCVDTTTKTVSAKIDFNFEQVTLGIEEVISGFQPRFFETFKGKEEEFWNAGQKNLLVIHGIWSSAEGFLSPSGVVQYFGGPNPKSSYYDHVLFYNYPYCRPIAENARALRNFIVANNSNAKFDIIGHSMGGLISRWLIEELGRSQSVDNLFMLGTPNLGANIRGQIGAVGVVCPTEIGGADDLLPSSSFMSSLNRDSLGRPYPNGNARKGSVRYHLFTSDGDEVVPSPTEILYNWLKVTGKMQLSDADGLHVDHSWIHETCATNGICNEIVRLLSAISPPEPPTIPPDPAPSDQSPPNITITTPTTASTFPTNSSTINVSGTASDNVGVTQVSWVNSRGGSGTASGTTNWSVSNITLQTGDNVITITARDAAGNTRSDTITVTLSSVPGGSAPVAPSELSLTVLSSDRVNLIWRDNSSNETGFKIERKTGSGGTFSTLPAVVGPSNDTGVSFEDTGLSASTTYCYRVKASNAAGDSSPSNEACATTNALPPVLPTAVTNSATNVTSTSATLNATINGNGVSTGAFFEWGTNAAPPYGNFTPPRAGITGGTTNTSFSENITNLFPNTTYRFRVVATNTSGGTTFGDTQTFTTAPAIGTRSLRLTINGTGAISLSPASREGTTSCSSTCTLTYNDNTTATLTASPAGLPASGTIFSRWDGCPNISGATCTIIMAADASVTANFSCFEVEVNNGSPSASPLVSGKDCLGVISTSTDVDWFKALSVSSGTRIQFALAVPQGLDYELEVYGPSSSNSSPHFLCASRNGTGSIEEIIFTTSAPGTFYARIFGANSTHFSPENLYLVRVNFPVSGPTICGQ